MKLPPRVLEEGILRIDGSGLSLIRRCWVEAWYVLGWRRIPAGRDEARGFGTAVHAALEGLRNKHGSGPYPKEALAMMEAVVDAEFQGVELPEEEYRTAGRCKEALGLWLKQYPEEDFDILASEVRKEKELGTVEWTQTVKGAAWDLGPVELRKRCRVIYQGRADFVCRDRRNGIVSPFDTKTAKEARMEQLLDEYRMSWTLPMYCWLFGGELACPECDGKGGVDSGGMTPWGSGIDVPCPACKGKGGTSFGPINDCIIDLMIVRKPLQKPTAKSAPRHEFHRLPFHYSDERIEEVKGDVLKLLGAWLTACGGLTPPPMTGAPEECHRFNRACGFLKVCEQEGWQRRLHWLKESAEFTENTWNPMEPPVRQPEASAIMRMTEKELKAAGLK